MKIKTFNEAKLYLRGFQKSQKEQKKLNGKLNRTLALANLAGNPQEKMKVIHIAGTSGKGSTCTILSRILADQRLKIGLSLSPHIYDIRERCQVNNDLISETTFCKYLNEFKPFIEKISDSKYGKPSYFEIMIVLAYYIFYKENVDYAAMETGLGGRLDATNIVKNRKKVVVITRIGKDHMDLLGNTLSKIAKEKSAIIQPFNPVFTIFQNPKVLKVIASQAQEKHSGIFILKKTINYSNPIFSKNAMRFDFNFQDTLIKNINLSLLGDYQAENSTLAIAVSYFLKSRDGFSLDAQKLKKTLTNIKIPARFDRITYLGKQIIIDGAHNEQKMSAFIKSLKKIHPNTKFDFLIAFKKGKNYSSMLKYIIPIARKITITGFAMGKQTDIFGPEETENILHSIERKYKYRNVRIEKDFTKAVEIAVCGADKRLIITGSIYLASDFYQLISPMT